MAAANGANRMSMAVAAAFAVACLVYVVVRAMNVPFTYDESYSYLHYVGAPLRDVLLFQGVVIANNHTLNSWLMTLAAATLGSSELALRLPNVLAFVGYAAAVLLLSRRLKHLTSRILVVVLLLLNPLVLEIFSLARGYGLALAFVLGSVATLAAALDPESGESLALRRLTQSTVLAGASVFANLAFLNYFLALAIVALAIRLSIMRRPGSLNPGVGALTLAFGSAAASLAIVGLYSGPALWRLRLRKELYYGGQRFWGDTVDSLIRSWLYEQPYGPAMRSAVWALVLLALGIGLLIAVWSFRVRPSPFAVGLLRALISILVLGSLGSVLQHVLLHTLFPIGRVASWMLPLLLLLLALEVEIGQSSSARFWRTISVVSGWIVAAACVAHAGLSANIRYATLQPHDTDTKQMLQDVSALPGSGRGLTLLTSWELAPAVEYYRVTRRLPWLGPVTDMSSPADVAFLSPKDFASHGRLVAWKRYPTTGDILFVAPERLSGQESGKPVR